MPARATVNALRPYTPEELKAISRQLGAVYEEAEQHLLNLLSERNITTWRRAFTRQQLARVRSALGELNGAADEWARLHVPTLYEHGAAVVDGHLAPGGLSKLAHPGQITPMDLSMTGLHQDAVNVLVENVATRLGDANSYCAQRIEDMVARAQVLAERYVSEGEAFAAQLKIREASLKALVDAFTEGKTQAQASKVFIAELRKRGITGFTDKAGRDWNMRRYADMVTVTVEQEAQRHGTQNRMLERGYDLVKVSDHAHECPLCKPWEGKVLSLTGKTKNYPTMDEALTAGLFHPTCSHAVLPYIVRAGR